MGNNTGERCFLPGGQEIRKRAVLTQPPALRDCRGGEAALCPTPTMGEVVGEVVVVVKQDFRDRGWLLPPPLVGLSPHRGI